MTGASPVCPKSSAPARKIVALRLEELTSHNWDLRLILTCLQGIVNRSQMFLIDSRVICIYNRSSLFGVWRHHERIARL